MADLQSFKQDIQSLVRKFEQDKNHYLQKGYPEAQVRIDFLNPFFDALGWDIENIEIRLIEKGENAGDRLFSRE